MGKFCRSFISYDWKNKKIEWKCDFHFLFLYFLWLLLQCSIRCICDDDDDGVHSRPIDHFSSAVRVEAASQETVYFARQSESEPEKKDAQTFEDTDFNPFLELK